jgi:hypothetical protein
MQTCKLKLGESLLVQGDAQEAREAALRALENAPELPGAPWLLATAAARRLPNLPPINWLSPFSLPSRRRRGRLHVPLFAKR